MTARATLASMRDEMGAFLERLRTDAKLNRSEINPVIERWVQICDQVLTNKLVTATHKPGTYNTDSYYKPWIALVLDWHDMDKRQNVEFQPEENRSIEKAYMQVPPGSVVIFGQKHRKQKRFTRFYFGIVGETGNISRVERQAAWQCWQSMHRTEEQ